MSKYENALKIKARNAGLIEDFQNQICTENRDKTGLSNWAADCRGTQQIICQTDMYHGYYGHSGVSSDANHEAAEELAKTLNELKGKIIEQTVIRLQQQIDVAMKAAAEEAKQVLKHAESVS